MKTVHLTRARVRWKFSSQKLHCLWGRLEIFCFRSSIWEDNEQITGKALLQSLCSYRKYHSSFCDTRVQRCLWMARSGLLSAWKANISALQSLPGDSVMEGPFPDGIPMCPGCAVPGSARGQWKSLLLCSWVNLPLPKRSSHGNMHSVWWQMMNGAVLL